VSLFYFFDKNEGSLEDVKHMYLFFLPRNSQRDPVSRKVFPDCLNVEAVFI
jgi:hypothetical protein